MYDGNVVLGPSQNFHRMQVRFKVLSISQEQAPLEIRELFHLTADQSKSLSGQIHQVVGAEEVLVLSTCNRTEIYVVSEDCEATSLLMLLGIERGIPNPTLYHPYFQWKTDTEETALHLFEVSMGLRSQVVGDLQISNQVKQAYALSAELQLAGPFLHRLLHSIFHTNKRVQQETAYRDGAASVSYASAELARELTGILQNPSALVVGMGEMAQDVARQLTSGGFNKISITNRTDEKAASFAQEIGVDHLPSQEWKSHLAEFQVVVLAVAAEQPLLTLTDFASLVGPKFIIDLSVPRSVSAEVSEVPGVILYDIDEIKSRTDEVLKKRLASVPDVQAIIASDLASFLDWSRELTISPTIQKLKDALEQIRMEEMSKFIKGAAPQEVEMMDKVTKSMVNKIMKLPVLQLKAACKRGEQESLIDVLNDLFDLDKAKAMAND